MGLRENLIFSKMVRKPTTQFSRLASACVPLFECACFAFPAHEKQCFRSTERCYLKMSGPVF